MWRISKPQHIANNVNVKPCFLMSRLILYFFLTDFILAGKKMYFPPFHAIGSVFETFHVPGLLYMQGPQMAVVRSVNAANSKLGRGSRWPDITLPLTHLPWVQCQVNAASCDSKHTVMPAQGDKLCFSIITGLIARKHWHRIKQKPLCMMGSQMAHKKGKESVLPSSSFFFLV